jgi:hypothetical protein
VRDKTHAASLRSGNPDRRQAGRPSQATLEGGRASIPSKSARPLSLPQSFSGDGIPDNYLIRKVGAGKVKRAPLTGRHREFTRVLQSAWVVSSGKWLFLRGGGCNVALSASSYKGWCLSIYHDLDPASSSRSDLYFSLDLISESLLITALSHFK